MAKEEIPRGQLSTIVLSTLMNGDKYGYEIIEITKDKTNGKLVIKQPSLYSCLRRMEEQGLINSYWRDSEIGGRRHYYSITDYGKKYAEKWQTDLNIFKVDKVEKDVDKINDGENVSQTILQQTNLFTMQKQNEEKNNTTIEQTSGNEEFFENKSFVQYNLFNSPTLISEPSNELFDSIKLLRESGDKNLTSNKETDSDKLSQLRNLNTYEVNNNIETSYVSNNYQANLNNNINSNELKKTFFQLSNKQKSFADTIKGNVNAQKFYDKDIDEEKNDNILNHLIKNSNTNYDINLNITPDNISFAADDEPHKNEDVTENIDNQECKNIQNKPTIYQNTNIFTQENDVNYVALNDDNKNNDSSLEFIDLNNINFDDQKNLNSPNIQEFEDITINNSNNINTQLKTITKADNTLTDMTITNETNGNSLHTLEKKDDAVYITDKIDISTIPKVKKIDMNRFEKFARYNDSLDKKVVDLYNQHTKSTEQIIESSDSIIDDTNLSFNSETINTDNLTDFPSLKKYYNNLGIKFGVYKKENNLSNNCLIKIKKLNLVSLIMLFTMITIETITMFFIYKNLQQNWNWLYVVFPIICWIVFFAYVVVYFKNRNHIVNKSNILNYNWVYHLVFSIVISLIIFSINLLCGMNIEDIKNYVTTLIYPCLIVMHLPILSLIKYILVKLNVVSIKH